MENKNYIMNNTIKLKLEKDIDLPKYESQYASGFDVKAYTILKLFKGNNEKSNEKLIKIKENFENRGFINLRPFERILFSTGITVAYLPKNLELQIRSRSGISLKRGLFIANQPGTIDADYRGIIGLIVYNSNPFLAKIEKNERIAQIVPNIVTKTIIESSDIIENTERGNKGFGSTNDIA